MLCSLIDDKSPSSVGFTYSYYPQLMSADCGIGFLNVYVDKLHHIFLHLIQLNVGPLVQVVLEAFLKLILTPVGALLSSLPCSFY